MAPDYTWMFLKMLFALGVVSAAAVIVLKYVVPRWCLPRKLKQGQYFKVLARYFLGPKKFLCLVSVGKRKYILGVADHGINLISEVTDDPEEKEFKA